MDKALQKLKSLWGRAWVRWALGYLFVLLCGVGVVYYWRVAYGLDSLSPWVATAVVYIECNLIVPSFMGKCN